MEPVRLIKPHQRSANTAQTPGMVRQACIAPDLTGSKTFWMGFVSAPPGASAAHHHGAAESGIYIVKGRIRMYYGERLENVLEAGADDFLYVPPLTIHVEENLTKDPVELVVARNAGDFMVVNVPDPRKTA
jgi:uncharacterized RmlC-like cupin family protein